MEKLISMTMRSGLVAGEHSHSNWVGKEVWGVWVVNLLRISVVQGTTNHSGNLVSGSHSFNDSIFNTYLMKIFPIYQARLPSKANQRVMLSAGFLQEERGEIETVSLSSSAIKHWTKRGRSV